MFSIRDSLLTDDAACRTHKYTARNGFIAQHQDLSVGWPLLMLGIKIWLSHTWREFWCPTLPDTPKPSHGPTLCLHWRDHRLRWSRRDICLAVDFSLSSFAHVYFLFQVRRIDAILHVWTKAKPRPNPVPTLTWPPAAAVTTRHLPHSRIFPE